jgi:hypothetical protein
MASSCTVEKTRARVAVSVTYAIDLVQRCAGDPTPYAIGESGDARPALSSAGAACFRTHNKFHPEATWSSLYALTELEITERPLAVTAAFPHLLARLLAGAPANAGTAVPFVACRDDGAYLDGTPGRPNGSATGGVDVALAALLATRAPLGGEGSSVGVTGDAFRSEQSLWEECNAAAKSGGKDLLVNQRCQLLRQLDRFVREVEDVARPQTPKGTGTVPSATPSTSASGAPSGKP